MIGFLTDITLWISAQTGLTAQVVGIIEAVVIFPVLGWITNGIDWAGKTKAVYPILYEKAQKANDYIVDIAGVGYVWEKWLEPYLIKHIMGFTNFIVQCGMAIIAGFNSRGESLVDKVEGRD